MPGELEDEILISTHVCHPSLCDDNLSGLAVSTLLARALAGRPRSRHTLRFLYAPGTIGAITWLAAKPRARGPHQARPHAHLPRRRASVHLQANRGRATPPSIARPRTCSSHAGLAHQTIDFFPYGYDERQYNARASALPVGSLMRGRHGQFPEYHTSADDLAFVSPDRLVESLRRLPRDRRRAGGRPALSRTSTPYGEPQLGKRGLYRAMGGTDIPDLQLAMLWVLNLSDGDTALLDIAERAEMPFARSRAAADLLAGHGLLATLD